MDQTPSDDIPEIVCPTCGQQMRLVGTERDSDKPRINVLTFECASGHVETTTFPN